MKKIVISLLVLSIIIIAVLKGSLSYLTQQFVENQIVQAKPLLQISYKDIKTSLSGRATVEDIKVFIPVLNESIRIKSIQLLAPDLITLLSLDHKLQKKQLPESLSLIINGASIDLSDNLINMMDSPDIQPSQIEFFSALACGNVYRIGGKALLEMGYDNITSDIVLKYRFNPRKKVLNYTIKNSFRAMTHINLSGEIQGITDLNSFSFNTFENDTLSTNTVKPGKITLEIVDDSYIERKNRFCAKQGNYQVDEYINEHIHQVKNQLLSYGIIPEEGLLNAYKTILETSGAMVFQADLSKLTGMEEIMTFEPNDIIQFIHLRLFVNDKRINEISIAIDTDKLINTVSSDEIEQKIEEKIDKKQSLIIKKYHLISTSALAKHNGYPVKIRTTNGKTYKGTINTKNPQVYEISRRLRSGTISYHIPVSTISKAEVFY